jgi:hypothetical protein
MCRDDLDKFWSQGCIPLNYQLVTKWEKVGDVRSTLVILDFAFVPLLCRLVRLGRDVHPRELRVGRSGHLYRQLLDSISENDSPT